MLRSACVVTVAVVLAACSGSTGDAEPQSDASVPEVIDANGVVIGQLVGVDNSGTSGDRPVWGTIYYVLDANDTLWTIDASSATAMVGRAGQTEYYETADCSGSPIVWSGPAQVPTTFDGVHVYKAIPPAMDVVAVSYRDGGSCNAHTESLRAMRTVPLGQLPITLGAVPLTVR